MKLEQFENIGILTETQELEKTASTKAIALLQADILYKRNIYNLATCSDLVSQTIRYLYSKTLAECHNIHTFGLLTVFAYGIEEGKRQDRARRKGGTNQ